MADLFIPFDKYMYMCCMIYTCLNQTLLRVEEQFFLTHNGWDHEIWRDVGVNIIIYLIIYLIIFLC